MDAALYANTAIWKVVKEGAIVEVKATRGVHPNITSQSYQEA